MKSFYYNFIFIFLSLGLRAQELSPKEIHDKATDNFSEVCFGSISKPVRDRVNLFENAFGIKLHFRVDDHSLDKLGGFSEHLFKLFQTFTSPVNTNVKTITGEFGALDDEVLSDIITYKTYATPDLRKCVLPETETEPLDSFYTKGLKNQNLRTVYANEVPESIQGLCSQSANQYEKILSKHGNCPDAFGFDPNAYAQHVINTRQNRANNWASSITYLSTQLTGNFSSLNSSQSINTHTNNGTTGVNSNIEPKLFKGNQFINLNNSVNECTQKDLEVRCRQLYGTTNIRFLFLTATLNYYLPLDSLTLFRNAVTQNLVTAHSDKSLIIALYLKMEDPSTGEPTATLLVKQNGDWLTTADKNFAIYNNGGSYKGGLLYKFNNLYKNIPKPLILCYQVAKVNGLLTTSYFKKGQHIKGREQIYFHILKIDKAFEVIGQLDGRLDELLLQAGANDFIPANLQKQIDDQKTRIKIEYLKANLQPEFKEVDIQYKDAHLQNEKVVHAASLRFIRDQYGQLYQGNRINSLIEKVTLPEDLTIGSCESKDNSDAVADLLNLSSLILSPTGFDFVPDALLVAYYASEERTLDAIDAAAAFLMPGNFSGIKKALNTSAEIIDEINKGNKIIREGNIVKSTQNGPSNIASAFGLKPDNMDAGLIETINTATLATKELLPVTVTQGKIFQNTEKLAPAKRLEFIKKCYDDANFRRKCLADPEEVLRWGGFIELIRGVKKPDFIASVGEFGTSPQLGEQAWNLFKEEKWKNLEDLINAHSLNGGWPPNDGFIDKEIIELPINFEFDRYGGKIENGVLSDNGSFVAPLGLQFSERALPSTSKSAPLTKYRVVRPIPGVTKGRAIPWFGQIGKGIQFKFSGNIGIDFLLQSGYIQKII